MGIVTHIATMKVLLCIVALLGVALAQENDCKDMNEKYCKERSHLCDKAAFKDFMKKFCSKTCGFYTLDDQTNEDLQTELVPAEFLDEDDDCKDAERESKKGYCKQWADAGFCKTHEKEMKIYCRKTCGFCTLEE